MKRLLTALTFCVILLLTVGCGQSGGTKEPTESRTDEKFSSAIEITIKETDVKTDTERINLIFTNTTDEEFIFGLDQQLEIKRGGEWHTVPLNENSAWNEIACILAPNGTGEQVFALNGFYKEIVPGDYRIIKEFSAPNGNQTACVEFTIA